VRPIRASWLTLRREADHRAREHSLPLVDALVESLGHREPVEIVDIGAGTGSNQAWLAPRLPLTQTWTLLDHDAGLIGQATAAQGHPRVLATRRVVAGIGQLDELLDDESSPVITCSAVLDLLTLDQARQLSRVIAARRLPALLSLTVTGEVVMSPEDPRDALIAEAFNAHQRRDGILGPDAAATVAELLREAGSRVTVSPTDWELGPEQAPLIERYLRDRAGVVVEHAPDAEPEASAWLAERLAQLERGELRLTVGHADILALPEAG
jgi:trans-aconitate methyltransferase